MKILVVDDHPLVRKGIISILSLEGEFNHIFEASNIEGAIRIIKEKEPEIAIVDLSLGKEDGLEIVLNAKKIGCHTKFIILTSSLKKDDFFRSRKAEVDGYILKEAFVEDILYAVKVVLRGKRFIDPEIVQYEIKNAKENNHFENLTTREREIIEEIGNGLSNSEIANKLFISENTVKKHVSNILFKLDLTHRTQVALLVSKTANF